MTSMFGVIIMSLLGVVGRAIIPYLQILKDNPTTTFDRKFIIPALASAAISVIGLPLVLSGLTDSAWLTTTPQGYVLIFVSAWGLADMARAGQKQISS